MQNEQPAERVTEDRLLRDIHRNTARNLGLELVLNEGEEFVGTAGADIGSAGMVWRIHAAGRRPHIPRPADAVISMVRRIADPHQHAG